MLQGAGAPKSSFGSTKNHSTRTRSLALSLFKELTFHNTLVCVLRTKDMTNKHLDGLEMFLGVNVTSRNSNNSKMVGGSHIYSPQT